ncbi:M28 family peptidase [Sphingomonas canadensis]|uniref:M28 family peptidase n=1 Tax=Sphingomonas canadensis TaxID=1219257 RepID=A0ABW3GZU1_9SPHN|nr:M28 family peptidase [Sphingomonas canadensis]MCW3835349.1 M28 family peptidase [Sphingomonas canadensis]
MLKPLIAAAVALLAAAMPAGAQTASPIAEATLRQVTETLASDAFEGRAPGTAGEEKSVAYLIERFRAAGLQPGWAGEWVQQVPMVETSARNMSALKLTKKGGSLALSPGAEMVANSFGTAPRIALKDSEVVFAGYGIVAPERGWNDYAGIDVRGKTVLILVNDPDWMSGGRDGPFGGAAMTYYGRWTYKFEEAARQGAAAAILVHDLFSAGYDWDVVRSTWSRPQGSPGWEGADGAMPPVTGWITQEAAQKLAAAAGKDLTALTVAAGQAGFRAAPLGLKASLRFDNRVRRFSSRNVIGMLPGSERPGEAVLYMAHWDHLGRCEAELDDTICNGAIDNAAGTAGLVALAETQAKAGPAKRSIIFAATTGEEAGLIGSRYYAAHPAIPLADTAGGVNLDTLAVYGATRDFMLAGPGLSELDALVGPLVAAQGREMAADSAPGAGLYYRSDHFSLARMGVPMLYPLMGEDMADGGREAGMLAVGGYAASRYHRPGDEYDPGWDWAGAVQDLEIHYRLGRLLADGTMWPEWKPGAEFRAIREESRKGR